MSKFTLEIVPEKKWKSLKERDSRYEFIDDDDFGFSDVKNGKVFVRQTAWPELMRETIHHEIDHLFEEGATDTDKHGIRHRKKRGFLGFINKAVPFLEKGAAIAGAPFTGGASLAALPFTKNTGSRFLDTAFDLGGAAAGAFGIPGTGFGGVFGRGGMFGGGGQGGRGFSFSPLSPQQNYLSQTGQFGGGGGGFLGKLKGMFGVGNNNPLSRFFGGGEGGMDFGQLGNFGTAAGFLGAAENVKNPEIPDFSQLPSVANLRQETEALRSGRPTSPLTQGAFGVLQDRFQPFKGVNPLILQQTSDAYDRLRNQYTSQYKMSAPNADLATDSKYMQGIAEIERRRAQDISGLQQAGLYRHQDLQTGAISEALGIDKDTLQSLGNLAQLDVTQIMAKTGLDAQRASQLRQMFGQVGGLFAARGLGLNQFNIPAYNIGMGGTF